MEVEVVEVLDPQAHLDQQEVQEIQEIQEIQEMRQHFLWQDLREVLEIQVLQEMQTQEERDPQQIQLVWHQ